MKHFLQHIILLLALSAVCVCAEGETTTHDIGDMISKGTLVLSESNTRGETALFTYVCSGTAKFAAMTNLGYSYSCLTFPSSTAVVVSSCAIPNLNRVKVTHIPETTCSNIKVYISKDGSTWTGPLSGSYVAGAIDVSFPSSDYYVKFKNTTSTNVGFLRVNYYTEDCDCKAIVE